MRSEIFDVAFEQHENLKSRSSMLLAPDPDSLVEELKCVHRHSYVWLNTLKGTILSLDIECYGWKVRRNYSEIPIGSSGNQLPPSMANSSKTDLMKKPLLKQKQRSPQIMPPVAKNIKVDSNTEIKNTSVDFNTLNYSEESINIYDTSGESELEVIFPIYL